jgi:hypothetical protein
MAISAPVLAYYRERVWAESGRDRVPKNFRPLEGGASGRSVVEGCVGGGKNVLELRVRVEAGRIADVRASCGLCNPAMYVAADVVCEWARGRAASEAAGLDPLDPRSLDDLFSRLGTPGRPEDAREKFQYALVALQNALRSARGEAIPPVPAIPPPSEREAEETEEPPCPCASGTR